MTIIGTILCVILFLSGAAVFVSCLVPVFMKKSEAKEAGISPHHLKDYHD